MNDIYSNYAEIPESELNKRVAFYEGLEFSHETISLMVPDVVGYVRKIFDCLYWAEQSRKIIEDICQTIVESRIAQYKIVRSISYNVGSLKFDGRTYLQQNIHHYCQYIAEINDCILQILNIVYNVGFRQWQCIKAKSIIRSIESKKHNNVKQQLNTFHRVITPHKELDNYVKHNLIPWGHEKLTPQCIENIDFHFHVYSEEYRAAEIISATKEYQIKSLVIELLDNVFNSISVNAYETRKYTNLKFDCLDDRDQLTCDSRTIPLDKFITLRVETELVGGTYKTKSIAYHCTNVDDCRELYLVRLEQTQLEDEIIQTRIDTLDINQFDVYQNGQLIGKYQCEDDKDRHAQYFHFKKYRFTELKT